MSEWMTIDKAPKDGTYVLAGRRSLWPEWKIHVPFPIKQKFNGKDWEATDGYVYQPQPTHFMHLLENDQ